MDFLKKFFSKREAEKMFTCEKCGKAKKVSEGRFALEGKAFCCKQCCGDVSKGEHTQKTEGVCEFC